MKFLRSVLVFLALSLACLPLVYAASDDRVVEFDNAVLLLAQGKCELPGDNKEDELKAARVVFRANTGIAPRKACWMEEDGVIWVIDDQLNIVYFPADRAKPADMPKKGMSI
jgi:hypothetical protein